MDITLQTVIIIWRAQSFTVRPTKLVVRALETPGARLLVESVSVTFTTSTPTIPQFALSQV